MKYWSWYERIWIVAFTAVALALSIFWKDTVFGFTVFLTGILCVVLAAKGNVWTYAFGAYNSATYAWLSYTSGLYGETMLNALYFLPMQLVGWLMWRHKLHGATVEMRRLGAKGVATVAAICALGTGVYGGWLSTLPGQFTPFLDAFTNVLSIVAMILMARRYREQWWLFFLVNLVSVAMWGLRAAAGTENAASMVVMWSAYLVNSVYGMVVWQRGSKTPKPAVAPTPRVGLTLGKFAPLHKGHQYLIETALREVDELLVVVYASDLTDIPLSTRAGWIRALHPTVTVLEAPDGPQETGDDPEIQHRHDVYLANLLTGRGVTDFYSSETYGEPTARALGARNHLVDPARTHIPIRATQIREDPYAARAFLDPLVYKDLIRKVVFLGAPSTGKSTLAQSLALRHDTAFMPEYGREYWETHQQDRRLSPEQLVEIGRRHLEREEALLLSARNILFVDTNAITTFVFALDYHGSALPGLEELARQAESRYDLVFLCGDDIPYDDTWDRSGDVKRHEFQQQVIEDLETRGLRYTLLEGSLAARIDQVERVLAGGGQAEGVR